MNIQENSEEAEYYKITKNYEHIGKVFLNFEEYEDTIIMLNKAYEISRKNDDEDQAYYLYRLGNVYEIISDFKQGKQCYETAMKLLPEDHEIFIACKRTLEEIR